MKKSILATTALGLSIFAMQGHCDTYDPATNMLTIPTITVDGIVYTDVVITVGSIVSIGGSSKPDGTGVIRKCSWTFSTFNDLEKMQYDLTVTDHGTIGVKLTGLTNSTSFFPFNVVLVQGESSTEVNTFDTGGNTLWQSYDSFTGGTIPAGVVKDNLLYQFPSWFDFTLPFKWVESGNEHTC